MRQQFVVVLDVGLSVNAAGRGIRIARSTAVRRVAAIAPALTAFTQQECARYLRNAGYASS